jgi:hypothetical protein
MLVSNRSDLVTRGLLRLDAGILSKLPFRRSPDGRDLPDTACQTQRQLTGGPGRQLGAFSLPAVHLGDLVDACTSMEAWARGVDARGYVVSAKQARLKVAIVARRVRVTCFLRVGPYFPGQSGQ